MSFWQEHQKQLQQEWEFRRRRIEREVAERRRDLVRRNMRQSSEWNSYEPYTDWYLEREVEAFLGAVDEVSSTGQYEIDNPSIDEMERMLADMIDRREQLAPTEVQRQLEEGYARAKGAARTGLLRIQSLRRAERERGIAAPAAPAVRRPSESRPDSLTTPPPQPRVASPVGAPAAALREEPAPVVDPHCLAESLRGLGQLIQRLPDAEEQAETLEELQFVAEEATVDPEQRKLRMVLSALSRIKARIAAADPHAAAHTARLADPVRRWFDSR